MAALRLDRLHPRLLRPVDLSIDAGALLFVSGPSGSGKSLLLRAIADLDPNEGDAFVGELARSRLRASEWRRRVGLLPAESGWWNETVGAHFRIPESDWPKDDSDRREQAPSEPALTDRLGQLGFDADVLCWTVSRLSTGERQRLALARLLANGPEALLLDEATANLDPSSRTHVERVVNDYRQKMAAAVLWVSHDPEQRARLSDRSLVIRDGKLQPEEVE
ncbi:MAG: ATP-binding cassette domain-containing protein [Thiohalocapsa sp.]